MKKSVTGLSGRESKQTNRRIAFAKIQLCVGLVSLAAPAWVPAVETGTPTAAGAIKANLHTFNIDKQQLYSALNAIAEQGGVQFVYRDEMVKGLSSPGVSGQLTTEDALNKVLEGSGLGYRFNNGNTITLEPKAVQPPSLNQTEPTTLPKVNVVGNVVYDVKDPYNEDYVLPSATAGTMTDTPIMATPLNIQTVSKQVLKDQQVITLADSLKNVSGVTADNSTAQNFGTSQSITFRGFSDTTYFRNGFRIQNAGGGQREMANVESIEVMKGSAAILYGLVEPGGMVNVIAKQPLATPYYSAQQQFGSFDLYRTTIDSTGPIADNKDVLYRLNMSYENSGSFRNYVNNEKIFVAPVLKWLISPKTQATFELEYNHDTLGLDQQVVPTYNGQLMKIPRSLNYQGTHNGLSDSIFGSISWTHQFNDNWSIKHGMMAYNQTVTAPANNFWSQALLGIGSDPVIYGKLFQWNNNIGNYASNINLTGNFDTGFLKHTLLMGGDYYRTDYNHLIYSSIGDLQSVNVLNPLPLLTNGGQVLDLSSPVLGGLFATDQYGAYFQDQIKLPYNFHFTGGFRYQNLHQTQTAVGVAPTALTQDAVTPRFGLLWNPENWLSVYGNYVESFGANSGIIYPGKSVPATGAQQWELGTKTEFFDGRLRATLAYYDLTKTNITTPDLVHPGSFVLATGAVRSRGPELDIQGEILPGWNIIATYTNINIKVTQAGINDYPAVGDRYPGVPRNLASFWNTYEFAGPELKGWKIGGGVTIRDNQLAFANSIGSTNGVGSPSITNYSIPGYATVDLMSSYSLKVGGSKITAQMNLNNLFNKYYLSNAYLGAGTGTTGFDYGVVTFGTPRTVMGSIKIEF